MVVTYTPLAFTEPCSRAPSPLLTSSASCLLVCLGAQAKLRSREVENGSWDRGGSIRENSGRATPKQNEGFQASARCSTMIRPRSCSRGHARPPGLPQVGGYLGKWQLAFSRTRSLLASSWSKPDPHFPRNVLTRTSCAANTSSWLAAPPPLLASLSSIRYSGRRPKKDNRNKVTLPQVCVLSEGTTLFFLGRKKR